jgi:hypothetical protein
LINTKESLRELVLEAESLVRRNINNDRTSKTEYFFNEIIAKSQQQQQQQRQKKMMEKSQKDTVKISRVQVSVWGGELKAVMGTILKRFEMDSMELRPK